MLRSKTGWIAIAIGVLILILDMSTKGLTQGYLPHLAAYQGHYPYGGIPIFENFLGIEFSIVHATNKGAAWGMFANYQHLLLYLRALFIAVLFGYIFFYNKNRTLDIPLMLVGAGAFSNVLDFFLYGHVIDMLHFVLWGYDYPVFNIADAAIFVGIFWLFTASLVAEKKQAPTHS